MAGLGVRRWLIWAIGDCKTGASETAISDDLWGRVWPHNMLGVFFAAEGLVLALEPSQLLFKYRRKNKPSILP